MKNILSFRNPSTTLNAFKLSGEKVRILVLVEYAYKTEVNLTVSKI